MTNKNMDYYEYCNSFCWSRQCNKVGQFKLCTITVTLGCSFKMLWLQYPGICFPPIVCHSILLLDNTVTVYKSRIRQYFV